VDDHEEEDDDVDVKPCLHSRKHNESPTQHPASKLFGVSENKSGTFKVELRHGRNKRYLGSFGTSIEAARAYDSYVVKHKLDKNLNFPKEHPKYNPPCANKLIGTSKNGNKFTTN